MNTVSEVMTELKKKGSAQTRKTFERHGAPENMFGVKVADLKVIAKKIKGNQQLACDLYDTGNSDAMYLAGLVADGSLMTRTQLSAWANKSSWYMISEYTVPGVAVENQNARELALKWIKSRKENVASAGWNTYAGVLATRPDEQLDLAEIKGLLKQVADNIHKAPNRVRYTMNGFVIAVGGNVRKLLSDAKTIAKKIGNVQVDVGDTSCKVPYAPDYIAKMESAGRIGKKRKTIKC